MPLLTYSHTRRYGPLIKQLVEAREMPPYQYDAHIGIQQLQHDWRLSEDDISTIVQWVEDGRLIVEFVPAPHRRSLAGHLADKATRRPVDEGWASIREAARSTPDPDRTQDGPARRKR